MSKKYGRFLSQTDFYGRPTFKNPSLDSHTKVKCSRLHKLRHS